MGNVGLKEFISVYNEAVSSGGEPSSIEITVIHGYGVHW